MRKLLSKLSKSAVRVQSPLRTAVILLFGIIGAVVFGVFGNPVLSMISVQLTRIFMPRNPGQGTTFPALTISALVLFGGVVGGMVGTSVVTAGERFGAWWDRIELGDKVNVFLASFLGVFVSVAILNQFQNVDMALAWKFSLLLGLMAFTTLISVYFLNSMAEVLPWSKPKAKTRRSGIKIMDTNVIIDGRIYDIARTGFLDGQLYVPGFVLEELQYIADSHDQLRRQRGRRGLEVLRHMQADFQLDVRTYDKLAPEMQDDVDARLVRLAKAMGADLLTNDFNLKRVAELQDIRVLSLNDLALALRPNVLPQESLCGLKIIREGNQYGQGVGYLEDGTMVVVENGQAHVGETRDVIVTQVIQTERGKMIFAEVDGDGGTERAPRRRR